jgi:two-component system, sensor histidine kinase and response regulator
MTKSPILVVDDNFAKRLALKAVLGPLGHPIIEADSGLAALRCVMAEEFAVILLDVCMPTMDGFETAALIRQRRQSEMTPIIFITAFGSDEITNADRYAEGAVDFIFAPVEPDELRAKVSVFANLFIKASVLATEAREVQTSADQLRLLTDAAPIGIFQTDVANRYVYTNPRWSEITGIAAEDAAGQEWNAFIGSELAGEAIVELFEAGKPGEEFSRRFEISRPNLPPRVVLVTSVSIPGMDGGMAGWVGTVADVTAEAGAELAMSKARDEATAASRLKSDFLANMSHEIRTPMNGVMGMTDLLLETDLDPRQRDYAQTVRSSGAALLAIINDILDFSKIEAGQLDIEDIEFNLGAIVDDVMDLLAGGAQTKGIELLAVTESSAPAVVSGDPGRLRQVLMNIIGNAIKFTQAGEIVVRITDVDAGDTDAVVRFEVSDTGDGIAPDKLDVIFQSFVQADASTSRKYGGTGLGLSISSELIALMGGECGVVSQLGAGSTFWFTIRVHTRLAQVPIVTPAQLSGLEGLTALIVDDNTTLRTVLADYLTGWGMTIATAPSAERGLTMLQASASAGNPFRLVLIDRFMPGMSGLELKDAIVGDPALAPDIVLMTSLGHERDFGGAAESGVLASLSKPIHRDQLLACLRLAIALPPLVAEQEPGEALSAPLLPGDDIEAGRVLLAEDNLINQKVVVAMLSSAGYRVDTVLNGAEAVLAVATRPYDAILMDCQMPELNGYEATTAIRSHEGNGRRTPIIAVTAGARREDRERCLARGMDGYLSKPLSKKALLAVVGGFIKEGHSVTSTSALADDPSQAETVLDLAVFDELRLLGGSTSEKFLADLVSQFMNDTDLRLLELHEALAAADALAVGRIAHGIEGSGGQLGGRRFAAACGGLVGRAVAGHLSGGQASLHEVEAEYHALCDALVEQLSSHDCPRDLLAHG